MIVLGAKSDVKADLEDEKENSVSERFEEPTFPESDFPWDTSFAHLMKNPEQGFSMAGNDVLVFVHIQKTAGTSFEKFLVRHLNTEHPCQYFYTTFLREPIARFISEYRHVNRGATWIASRHICNGRAPTSDELPLCFDPHLGWDDVSLDEFLHCPFNLAFNRQTRMLADLTLVNCYARNGMDPKTRNRILLESAKSNLRNMAFFGIKERMDDSQVMFERLFNLSFNRKLSAWSRSKSNDTDVTPEQMRLIREHNELDIQLYDYALKLFEHRFAAVLNRTMSLNPEGASHFTPFEFKSSSNNQEVQFIRDDGSPPERVFHKLKNNVLSDPEYESEDDVHASDENADIEFDRV
ncbi:heparan sulfate 6-sulfotransferase [Oesophagostomum dentatum]|uniref:Heparan-sulfate 6-O-sulfotransferase n=1 Tax=Oesophagostomum dentatum TaxID=61180 RepID=A0A0B1TTW3_OESDE|nr:heparan sulfate 6-sulfotransferase [Oesophagostomum dentatum]